MACLLSGFACSKADRPETSSTAAQLFGTTTTVPLNDASTTSTGLPATTTSSLPVTSRGTLGFPKAGTYTFRESLLKKDLHNVIKTDGTTVKVYSPESKAFYVESHSRDGIWLTLSATTGGACQWDPRVASLPVAVIDGGSVMTTSTCTSNTNTLTLTQTLTFKSARTVLAAGQTQRVVDVIRHRVLSDPTNVVTSDAVDTYSLDLGLRIAMDEHTSTRTAKGTTQSARKLVITAVPA